MTIHTFYFNPYRECTYVLTDLSIAEEPDACIIIDAGMYSDSEQARFRSYLSDRHLHPIALLITHSHPDHICGAEWLKTTYGLSDLHSQDELTLYAPVLSSLQILCIPTPGHYPDSVCYYFPAAKALFTGDTLFHESIGRTDLPGADGCAMMASLKHLMEFMPDNTNVYPGHGITTSIGHERQYNPYL